VEHVAEKTDEQGCRPGERLQKFLEEKDMTQTDLARMCDVTPQYVNNTVRGRQRLSQKLSEHLSQSTDINLNWLYTGEGQMSHNSHGQRTWKPEVACYLRDACDLLGRALHALEREGRLIPPDAQ
jgi:transcriptional regulator with XRE-family HTH domain